MEMRSENIDPELAFVLLHGSWHDKRCWDRLAGELSARGHRAIAMDLDPFANFDEQAAAVAETIQDEENIVLVGHSRGANIAPRIPRLLGKGAVSRILLVAGSLLPETIGTHNLPERNYPEFVDAIDTRDGVSTMDPHQAREVLYNCCEEDIALTAIRRLRPYRRNGLEPILDAWPDVPTDYLAPREDNVITPEWVAKAAPFVRAQVTHVPGDHSPMLSHPDTLAQTMIRLAQQDVTEPIRPRTPVFPRQATSYDAPRSYPVPS